jgi:hypothetical protein
MLKLLSILSSNLILAVACTANQASKATPIAVTPVKKTIDLVPVAQFPLSDDSHPIEWLAEIAIRKDGTFLQSDRRAKLIRHFSPTGKLLAYVAPLTDERFPWRPERVRLDPASGLTYISNNAGAIARLSPDHKRLDWIFHGYREKLYGHRFLLGPRERIYVVLHRPPYTLHLLDDKGRIARSFLESDENGKTLVGYVNPNAALATDGSLYAVRPLEDTIFRFSLDGVELSRWRPLRNRHFRPFSKDTSSFGNERNPDVLRAWERTFSYISGIYVLRAGNIIIVFTQNAPPEIPNTIDVYSKDAEFYGTVETPDYLVGADSQDRLYFSNCERLVRGPCVMSTFALEVT